MDLHINAVSKQLDKQVPLLNDPLHASGIAFIVDFQGRLVGATTTQDDLLIDATTSRRRGAGYDIAAASCITCSCVGVGCTGIDPTIAEASGALKALYPDLSKVPAKVANMPVSGYSMTAMPLQLASRSNEVTNTQACCLLVVVVGTSSVAHAPLTLVTLSTSLALSDTPTHTHLSLFRPSRLGLLSSPCTPPPLCQRAFPSSSPFPSSRQHSSPWSSLAAGLASSCLIAAC